MSLSQSPRRSHRSNIPAACGCACGSPSILFFLYAPLVALVAFSFNDSRRNIVWRGFTFKYYDKAWTTAA